MLQSAGHFSGIFRHSENYWLCAVSLPTVGCLPSWCGCSSNAFLAKLIDRQCLATHVRSLRTRGCGAQCEHIRVCTVVGTCNRVTRYALPWRLRIGSRHCKSGVRANDRTVTLSTLSEINQIGFGLPSMPLAYRILIGRVRDRDEDSDYRHHHHQFDQGETAQS